MNSKLSKSLNLFKAVGGKERKGFYFFYLYTVLVSCCCALTRIDKHKDWRNCY